MAASQGKHCGVWDTGGGTKFTQFFRSPTPGNHADAKAQPVSELCETVQRQNKTVQGDLDSTEEAAVGFPVEPENTENKIQKSVSKLCETVQGEKEGQNKDVEGQRSTLGSVGQVVRQMELTEFLKMESPKALAKQYTLEEPLHVVGLGDLWNVNDATLHNGKWYEWIGAADQYTIMCVGKALYLSCEAPRGTPCVVEFQGNPPKAHVLWGPES
eukprot:TRINITY_DN61667_c0_g2_i1.p1 TRINITY_DN61667_c0_g2~~TRINITY_DN61667_c0_g2_i1.p1  ORF type:complete len:214 (+),score=7.02 TRINITY_DN61667_c0_g2_i1:50-691(+)